MEPTLQHPALLRPDAADLDRGLIGHLADQVLGRLTFTGEQRTKHRFTALTEPVPEHLEMSDAPGVLELVDLAKHGKRSTVAGLITGSGRLFETDGAARGGGERVARGAGEGEDGVVAGRVDKETVRLGGG